MVGYIFDIDDQTVWSPSRRAGLLYVDMAEVAARSLGLPTGLNANAVDMYQIDLPTFRKFTSTLLSDYYSTNHAIIHEMIRGVLLASLAMLQRGGVELSPEDEAQERLWSALPDFARSMPT
ncbi:DUF6086 family protein [Actinomadura decatromicini]|uniref:Uncharacterized protein n=1 Tax=Actinomadura decatromicini TaxID=2604572 RepID=A0A5D3FA82_9ACTN|nr:DUF6086 family protein [Actinomadura decatromicini]TYK44600.1 hypothetical protein FXF68_34710 [Actinomadura decatromicini]